MLSHGNAERTRWWAPKVVAKMASYVIRTSSHDGHFSSWGSPHVDHLGAIRAPFGCCCGYHLVAVVAANGMHQGYHLGATQVVAMVLFYLKCRSKCWCWKSRHESEAIDVFSNARAAALARIRSSIRVWTTLMDPLKYKHHHRCSLQRAGPPPPKLNGRYRSR